MGDPVRVLLVTGRTPGRCGVSDYSYRLMAALRTFGVEVDVAAPPDWGLGAVYSLVRQARREGFDLVHLQYPAAEYRFAMAPVVLPVLLRRVRPVVATIHELTVSHPLRKVATLTMLASSDFAVFTSECERQAASRLLRELPRKSAVIPIASNIPFIGCGSVRDPRKVVYFGLLRPRRGLEEFLALARLADEQGCGLHFVVLGASAVGREAYLERIRAAVGHLPNVSWRIGLAADDVAAELASSSFAYLPYAEGATERHSSVLAALANGVVVISRKGRHTPAELEQAIVVVESERDALSRLLDLAGDERRLRDIRERASEWMRGRDWDAVARAHRELYERLLQSR